MKREKCERQKDDSREDIGLRKRGETRGQATVDGNEMRWRRRE